MPNDVDVVDAAREMTRECIKHDLPQLADFIEEMAAELDRQRGEAKAMREALEKIAADRPGWRHLRASSDRKRIAFEALAYTAPPCQNSYGICDQNPPCTGTCRTRAQGGGNAK